MTDRATLQRDAQGVVHVRAADLEAVLWGLGRAHARDRGLQMLLMRLLGQGRACEVLDAGDDTLRVDVFFRRMNWSGATPDDPAPGVVALAQAYCDGVNAGFADGVPWELRLLGYRRPEPWRVQDCLLLARMTGYLTLAQSQAEIERAIVEMVQAGIDRERLEELFPGQLEGLDVELLRRVRLGERLVPAATRWGVALPRPIASNNWVVAGRKTASGAPLLANDPHLEANRLPNVWYEVVLEAPDRWALGATMPGLPGILIGRTPDLAWGATYAFMDAVDSWVEECRDGAFRRDTAEGTRWLRFRERREVIRRRGRADHVATFYENDHGVLDGDPTDAGLYLASRWSGAEAGWRSLQSILEMWSATSVEEGRGQLGRLEPAFNWVLADRSGHIGYQMSGLMPRRRSGCSGLVPLLGWQPEDDWRGFHEPEDLPRVLDPPEGFFVTANHDLNAYGQVAPISVPMGPDRADRIAERLAERDDWTPSATQELQQDRRSRHAERLLDLLRPFLDESPAGRALSAWDARYDVHSKEATVFENVYEALLEEVFVAGGFGAAWSRVRSETGLLADFHHCFDRVLLNERSAWLSGRDRDGVLRVAVSRGLERPVEPWGDRQQVTLAHLLLGGKLPRWLGFDRGPIPLPGGRGTVQQGQAYRSGGRLTSFAPTFRLVTDLSERRAFTCLLGGPSDRRFSHWYASEIAAWREGRYKELAPDATASEAKTDLR